MEDCIEKIANRFDLVMVAARRSRDVASGAEINVCLLYTSDAADEE